MTQVNDRSTESDETFQREVLERFDEQAPAPETYRDYAAATWADL